MTAYSGAVHSLMPTGVLHLETTEKIVEAYARYVKGWATIPNIRCRGQYEIDLLAIDPVTNGRYHIESGVSLSGAFSKLTTRPFDRAQLKLRVQQPAQRRTLGYFLERKFAQPEILETLKTYGFEGSNYVKVIVSWGWRPEVEAEAEKHGIMLWDFGDLMKQIADELQKKNSYFTDDTLRTLHLYARAVIQ